MPEAYALKELNVKNPRPKRQPWPVAWYYNKPPPAVFAISLHLSQHVKTPPKSPFVAHAVGRTEGAWSVVDLGEKGWFAPNAMPSPGMRPAPWTGDVSCYLNQPLGYERRLHFCFEALKAIGRITKTEFDAATEWLKEELDALHKAEDEIAKTSS